MAKRRRDRGGSHDVTDWSTERTLADAEADAAAAAEEERLAAESRMVGVQSISPAAERALPTLPSTGWGDAIGGSASRAESSATCACGSEEFLLEAYLAVVRGVPQREPVELELLTCPQCGREYEAIWLEDGRVARGEYRGQTDIED